jgi:hypothetical protein
MKQGSAICPATTTEPGASAVGVEVCTRDPDCGLHEVSLDAVLDEGRPVVLLFATPAYCQTAVCGPAVDVLEEAATARDWGEVAFIHCEIFEDEGQTMAGPVEDWGLPNEPWLFTIDRDGQIVDRADGPVIQAELQEFLERLS